MGLGDIFSSKSSGDSFEVTDESTNVVWGRNANGVESARTRENVDKEYRKVWDAKTKKWV